MGVAVTTVGTEPMDSGRLTYWSSHILVPLQRAREKLFFDIKLIHQQKKQAAVSRAEIWKQRYCTVSDRCPAPLDPCAGGFHHSPPPVPHGTRRSGHRFGSLKTRRPGGTHSQESPERAQPKIGGAFEEPPTTGLAGWSGREHGGHEGYPYKGMRSLCHSVVQTFPERLFDDQGQNPRTGMYV